LAGLLRHLTEQHGSVRDYVRALGVTTVMLAGLEEALLEEQ